MTKHRIYPGAIAQVVAETHEKARDIANEILQDAQRLAPVDTGYLRQSGYMDDRGDSFIVGFTADYAGYVEFGTSQMRSQPFLLPAAVKRRG